MIKNSIPNFITSCNLICGCIGITMALNGQLTEAGIMIWIAAGFDFFDGFSARMLKVSSEIGKQLDSLADMVTFGVLPACIVYQMIGSATTNAYLPFVAFLIAVFSALRLAKFNIDTNQSDSFIGVPTPANAILISALPFIVSDYPSYFESNMVVIMIVLTIVMSWLLVANINMIALKFKDYSWANNKMKFIFLATSIALIIGLQISAIPLVIFSYVAFSLLGNALKIS